MKICIKCGKEHNGSFGSGKYCSRQCSNSRTILKEVKNVKCIKCGSEVSVGKRTNPKKVICKKCVKIKFCKYCGAEKGKCKRPDICKKYQIFPSLIKYFGFNEKVIGTEQLYEEFERVKNLLIEDYITNELSTVEIQEKYKCFNQRVVKAFKNFDIENRGLSKATSLAYINGKLDKYKLVNGNKGTGHPQYVHGYHTTWNKKQVFLRSSYEFNYAKELDKEQIDYEVEKLRILYWDSQLLRQRIAIPDFYLTHTNTIIEIKSDYTLNEQNMKDKFKAYQNQGYNCKLILNKKEVKF